MPIIDKWLFTSSLLVQELIYKFIIYSIISNELA